MQTQSAKHIHRQQAKRAQTLSTSTTVLRGRHTYSTQPTKLVSHQSFSNRIKRGGAHPSQPRAPASAVRARANVLRSTNLARCQSGSATKIRVHRALSRLPRRERRATQTLATVNGSIHSTRTHARENTILAHKLNDLLTMHTFKEGETKASRVCHLGVSGITACMRIARAGMAAPTPTMTRQYG